MCFRLWEHTYFFYGGKYGTVPILRKGICGQLLSAMRRTQTETKRLSSVQRGAVAANEILPPMRIRISRPQTERGGKNALTLCAGKAAKGNQNSARDHLSRLRCVLRLRKFSARRTARKFNLFGQARVCRVRFAEIGIAPLCADRDQSANLSSLRCIKQITLPDAIVSIGESAFEGCRALTAAVLPQNLRVLGREAFARCESLTEVTIFPKIAMIGGYAFNGCKRLTDIRFYGTRAQWEGIKKGKNIFSPAHPAIHCTDETIEN